MLHQPNKSPITIAIADDHTLFRNGIRALINSFANCHVILEANDGLQLLSELTTREKLPDICILDISMPKMNGYDLLTAVKKNWPDQKTIILSMYDDEYAVLRMIKNGANGFLIKSCDYMEFEKAILQVYQGGFFFSGFSLEDISQKMETSLVPDISGRQLEFLALCGTDMNYIEIAREMGISKRAVESLHQRLSEKLNIHTRVGLALFARKTGLITS